MKITVNKWWLHALFFVSGFPALLYQIVWERSLFTIFGTNIESVTVIVAAFMLGLGAGSLVGARVAADPGRPLPQIFAGLELGTACFGILSLKLFHAVATSGLALNSTLAAGALAFLLLLLPTMLMGSTLPILAAYVVSTSGNVGRSVGSLYCVNTLGSAAGCFFAAAWGMGALGLSGSVVLAACLNALVGLSVLILGWKFPRRSEALVTTAGAHERGDAAFLRFPAALMVAGLCGFVALGYEILWFRAYSFATADEAATFPVLLGCYLAGVGLGALVGRMVCGQQEGGGQGSSLEFLALFLILSALLGYTVIPAASRFVWKLHGFAGSYLFITAAALLFGASFPLVMHAGVRPERKAGLRIGLLYAGNIAGSTLGSFLVGYILMDHWTMKQIAIFLALCSVVLGMGVLWGGGGNRRAQAAGWIAGGLSAVAILATSSWLFGAVYERLLFKQVYVPPYRFRHVVETKSGVITVTPEDWVYGGGAYDGKFSTSLVRDVNGLFRPFSLSLWHPQPRRVLMIGLSSGSWAQVVANHPQVESLTIVEINPGYLRLIPQYPAVAGLLKNPKVKIEIDDGRRWLRRHAGERFDVVIMNTTFYWRAHASHLLSREFLELVREHLSPGGVAFYNTTGSRDVQLTGVTVFPYAVLIWNCIAVSDRPLALDWDRWRRTLREYRIDGIPIFQLDRQEDLKKYQELGDFPTWVDERWGPLFDAPMLRKVASDGRVVTDDNMACEWPKR
jgi:predicted membrane-bound spermidine synthase